MKAIDIAWKDFQTNGILKKCSKKNPKTLNNKLPKCSDIYISTKTNIIYLTNEVNLKECFCRYF